MNQRADPAIGWHFALILPGGLDPKYPSLGKGTVDKTDQNLFGTWRHKLHTALQEGYETLNSLCKDPGTWRCDVFNMIPDETAQECRTTCSRMA